MLLRPDNDSVVSNHTLAWTKNTHLTAAVYPRTYNPSFATGACVLAIIFASTFAIIFPLIGPAVVVLLFLTLVGK